MIGTWGRDENNSSFYTARAASNAFQRKYQKRKRSQRLDGTHSSKFTVLDTTLEFSDISFSGVVDGIDYRHD